MKKFRMILLATLAFMLVFALCACNHEHQFEVVVTKEPTCTETGVSHKECTLCGAKEEDEIIPALGHEFAKDENGDDVWTTDAFKHWHECLREGIEAPHLDEDTHKFNEDLECTVCSFATFVYREEGEGFALTKYNGTAADIVVPSTYQHKPVVKIDDRVFYQNVTMTSVTIPESVKSIGKDAFAGATALETVKATSLAAWLDIKFENYASNPMSAAEKLYFGETQQGEALDIPSGTEVINEYAFYGLNSLTSVTIPESVTSIGYRAFEGAFAPAESGSGKLSQDISVNITDIDKWCAIDFSLGKYDADKCTANPLYYEATLMLNGVAFEGNRELPAVIKANAFYGYDKLTDISSSATEIGEYAFANCSALRSADLNSLLQVPKGAFEGCSALEEVSLGSAIKIGETAFEGCAALASVDLPASLTEIGQKAFADCALLNSVQGADGLVKVGEAAFYGTKLFELAEGQTFAQVRVGNVLVGIKGGLPATGENAGELEIETGIVAIADGALSNVANLVSVKLPSSVKTIGKNAFRYTGLIASKLASVELGEVEEIGEYAFAGNASLARIRLVPSLKKIGQNAFVGCSALKEVYASDVSVLLGIEFENAQANPLALSKALYIGTYDPSATTSPTAATLIIIPDETQKIGAYAFYGLTGVTSVVLPDSVTQIAKGAFEGCSSLRYVYYKGTEQGSFDEAVSVEQNALPGTVYYFSATRPESSASDFWHLNEQDLPERW